MPAMLYAWTWARNIAPKGRSYKRDKTDCVGLARVRV